MTPGVFTPDGGLAGTHHAYEDDGHRSLIRCVIMLFVQTSPDAVGQISAA